MWIAICIFAVPFLWGLDAESLLHFNVGTLPPLHTRLQGGYMSLRKPTQRLDIHSVNPKAVPESQTYALFLLFLFLLPFLVREDVQSLTKTQGMWCLAAPPAHPLLRLVWGRQGFPGGLGHTGKHGRNSPSCGEVCVTPTRTARERCLPLSKNSPHPIW